MKISKQLECTSCGKGLGSSQSFPSPDLSFFWLGSESWKMRLPFCKSCIPSSELIDKLKATTLKKSKLPLDQAVEWGKEITIDEYCDALSGGVCKDCGEEFGENGVRMGWYKYHPQCIGIYGNIKND